MENSETDRNGEQALNTGINVHPQQLVCNQVDCICPPEQRSVNADFSKPQL